MKVRAHVGEMKSLTS